MKNLPVTKPFGSSLLWSSFLWSSWRDNRAHTKAAMLRSTSKKLYASMCSFAQNLYNAFLVRGEVIDLPLSSCVISSTCLRCRFCGSYCVTSHTYSVRSISVSNKRTRLFEFNICSACIPSDFIDWATPRYTGDAHEPNTFSACAPFTREFIAARQRKLINMSTLQTQLFDASPQLFDASRPYPCYICARVMKYIRFHQRHNNIVHLGYPRVYCEICDECVLATYVNDAIAGILIALASITGSGHRMDPAPASLIKLFPAVPEDVRRYIVRMYISLPDMRVVR